MAKTNVLNKEYEQLQTEIITLTEKWYKSLSEQTLVLESEKGQGETPILPQLQLAVDFSQYKDFIIELLELLKERQPGLTAEFDKVTDLLDEELLEKWFEAAIKINSFYFNSYSEQNGIPEWLVPFVSETAVRPFLQKAQEELREDLKSLDHKNGCPCCGEPPRFAVIGKSGKKEVTCPRCHYSWEEKKISCAHCGTDNHENLVVLKVEGEESSQVHACKSCNGYTKVIDTKRLIDKVVPALLDSKSIHLDYIAQEKGFGVSTGSTTH